MHILFGELIRVEGVVLLLQLCSRVRYRLKKKDEEGPEAECQL